ncbi:hypothetical protein TNCT_58131 [Trichonephila clavata]|uniref:Uncharacterized protein n=1 Tax=Trichonephila clavata TaxID=2740835 RepID=A0A8X6IXL2_TRICU|nr:hypothetical protein TNCT_58131 [Trichonephila clavata]
MDISPTKNSQLEACEKPRETITGISAIHQTLQQEGSIRTPSPRNSFIELYRKNTEAIMRRKEDLASELRTLPSCTRTDCNEHKIPPL